MNGLSLALILIVLGIAVWTARPERRWFEPWSIADRRELRRAIPAGVLSAFLVMAVIATALAAGPAPR